MNKIAVWLCVFLFFPMSALALGDGAKAAILIDGESGRVLYEKNADEMLPMASTTKIMTALLALELSRLDETVTAGENAFGVPGTSLYLSKGEQLSMEHMLYGLLLRSGNDAAVAIAEHIAGGVDAFCDLMNARAEQLGADAHYENPHGLDQTGHAASARALALIMRECMENPDFRIITGTTKKVVPWVGNDFSRVLTNKNRLLTGYEGATGGKTGFTNRAGRCLVFSAERDGMELIGVVLNCGRWFDAAEELLDFGFDQYSPLEAARAGDVAGTIPVYGGREDGVSVVLAEDLYAAARDDEEWDVRIEITPSALNAPVEPGWVVGSAVLMIAGEEADRTELVTGEAVLRNDFSFAVERIFERWAFLCSGC